MAYSAQQPEGGERLNGMVVQIVFQSMETGFCVLELLSGGETVPVVGELAGVAPGEELTLTGSWVEHASFGRQFRAVSCEYRLPDTEAAILQYLSSGVLPGVGSVLARRIVDAFGIRTLEVMQTEPQRLADRVKGVSLNKARQISRELCALIGLRESVGQLGEWGINAASAMAAYRQYGPDTVALVRENPYLLCEAPVHLPFAAADDAAAALGLDPESECRRQAGLLHVLRHNLNNGHTCLPRTKLLAAAAGFLCAAPEELSRVLDRMLERAVLLPQSYHEQEFICLPEYFRAELYAAARLKQLLARPCPPVARLETAIDRRELVTGVKYAPLQRQAIAQALTSRVLVLTGGPGTGKTTTVNAILGLLEEQQLRVALAAPTGRAAKRLAELTGCKASTIHRLLEVDPKSSGGEELRFVHNEANPLRADAVVVDEMSMVDALLFESLLRALRPDCRLILVGDADQLPSVGAGNVLRGILESGAAPVVCLKEIFRQAAQSRIVSNAHRIVAGEMPLNGGKEDDFFFLQANGTDGPDLLCDLIARRLPARYGFSPVQDIQVLCATRLGPLGTEQLNRRLQQLLNPPVRGKGQLENRGITWREGDKVMQIRNNYDITWRRDDGEEGTGAFNGDIGVIERADRRAGSLQVRFDDRVCLYEGEALAQLELAYAVTVHKSQGSEFDAVILPVAEVPARLCYRNLLYTGVTRAKKLLVLLGQPGVLGAMVRNDKRILRYSCFADLLRDPSIV